MKPLLFKIISFSLITTLSLIISVDISGQCSEPIAAQENAIHHWQFDGGLDGWRATNTLDEDVDQTATLPAIDEGNIFGWVWDAEGGNQLIDRLL